jgi:hypothetical protein
MAAVLYGATVYNESNPGSVVYRQDALGKNSEVFTQGDIVGLSSGLLLVTTATMIGVVTRTQTMASTNQTVAKVAPLYVPITDDTLFLMGTDSDLTGNATDGGTYYSITGATGTQQVAVSDGVRTGANRNVEIVEVDPFNIGGTGLGSGLR